MALLGYGGRLRLKRETPEPITVQPVNAAWASNAIYTSSPAFWSGDQVTLSCARGLPLPSYDDLPACPDGYAIYAAGPWPLNPRTLHLQDDNSVFYAADDTRVFYTTTADVGQLTTATHFIYRDQLDRISFYENQVDAINGNTSKRIVLNPCDFGNLIVSATDSNWVVQGDMQNWSLNLTAPEVDTTAVGERFGDAVKAIVNGGGTIDFFVDRRIRGEETDSTFLLRLLLLTNKGCKAQAEFWMIENRADDEAGLLPGDLYYETDILITSSAVNLRADEAVAGSVNFVTVGEIALRMGVD